MGVYFLIWGTISFVFSIYPAHADNTCYQAKICVHDGKEKCGRDGDGNVRRFLDSCDIKEYNCLKGAEYTKVQNKECRDLPSVDEQISKGLEKKNRGEDDQEQVAEDIENQDNSVDVDHQQVESKDDFNNKKQVVLDNVLIKSSENTDLRDKEKRRNKKL